MSRTRPPDLPDLTYPVMAFVLEVVEKAGRGQHADFNSTASRVRELIDDAERRAALHPPHRKDFQAVKRALAYWADEVLINSNWAHRQAWEANTLEAEYYRELLRAVRFYEWAEAARGAPTTAALEHFLLAVALNFQGQYRGQASSLAATARSFFKRYLERNETAPLGGSRNAPPLRALPGATVLLAACTLVAVTALVTLACFLWSHGPARYRV